jgi:hypothetical protein
LLPTRHLLYAVALWGLLQQLAAAAEVYPDNIFAVGLFGVERMAPEAQENKGGSARALQLISNLKLPKDDTLLTHEQLSQHE